MGNKVQLFVLALALLLGQLNCQSISLGDVFVKWNRFVNSTGDFTRFVLTSTLPKVTDVRDAWIAIGLNNQYQIVRAFFFFKLSFLHFLFESYRFLI